MLHARARGAMVAVPGEIHAPSCRPAHAARQQVPARSGIERHEGCGRARRRRRGISIAAARPMASDGPAAEDRGGPQMHSRGAGFGRRRSCSQPRAGARPGKNRPTSVRLGSCRCALTVAGKKSAAPGCFACVSGAAEREGSDQLRRSCRDTSAASAIGDREAAERDREGVGGGRVESPVQAHDRRVRAAGRRKPSLAHDLRA